MIPNLPQVSVIIPTHNRREKLERALKSVFSQTLNDLEIIVVDNASTDQTQDFVKGINDPRLRYIRHDTNKGAPAARNTGIDTASTAFIALLDDDDEWMPQKLELQMKKFKESSPTIGLVYAGAEIFNEQRQRVEQINHPEYRGNVYRRVLMGTIFASNSTLIKKECFEKVGKFDEQLTSCQDWDMWLRIAKYYEFDYVTQILARINMHGGEQISTNFATLIPGRTRMVQKHAQEFAEYPDIYVVHLKRLGKLHCLNGTWGQAWDWFKKAMKVRNTEIIKIIAWLVLEFPFVRLLQFRHFKKYVGA